MNMNQVDSQNLNKANGNSAEYTPSELVNIIQDVIDDEFETFDIETMANYFADFYDNPEYLPSFLNIVSYTPGFGFGYIVFHDFLRRVGFGNTFSSTAMTDEGRHLFEKAQRDGLIEYEKKDEGIVDRTIWRVTSNPITNLERIKEQIKE